MRKTIEKYYKFRQLVTPDGPNAFWFFVTEVGELAAEYLNGRKLSDTESLAFNALQIARRHAEAHLSATGRPWVRNNGSQADANYSQRERISDEAGDSRMMLEVWLEREGLPDSDECLLAKMAKKGYQPSSDERRQLVNSAEWSLLSSESRRALSEYVAKSTELAVAVIGGNCAEEMAEWILRGTVDDE